MFSVTTKDGSITVFETFHDFQVRNNQTDTTTGIGDGVGMFCNEEFESIPVGTIEFYELLEKDVLNHSDYYKQMLGDTE